MSNSNLWPSKGRILNLGQDAPSEILKEQAGYIKQIDPMLTARVKENYGRNDHLPLKAISFLDININWGKTPEVKVTSSLPELIAFNLTVGRDGKSYSSEILRIRFNLNKYYPLELWDASNSRLYNLSSKEEYLNCLKEIFNSDECLKRLRYILVGDIV